MTEKIALITGSGRGIGAATAKKLAFEGYHVILTARSEDQLQAVRQQIAEEGQKATVIPADLNDRNSVNQLVEQCLKKFTGIDLLVNNAGYCQPCTMLEMSDEEYDKHFEINVTAVYRLCRAFAKTMIERKSGLIINVASIAGVHGVKKFPGFTAYAAAKAAVIVLTEVLAAELKAHNVRVNCISPGSVDTTMLKAVAPGIEPDMTPEEIAGTISYLCSPAARPLSGRNIQVFSS